jgi:opacity protein-like surface antigen
MFHLRKIVISGVLVLIAGSAGYAQSSGHYKKAERDSGDLRSGSNVAESDSSSRSSQTSNPIKDRGGWVIAAFVGGAHEASSALRISQPSLDTELTFENVGFETRSFDPPLYYGFRGSYFIPRAPFLGAEAEFIHLKVFSDPQQRVRATGVHRGVPTNRELALGEIVQQYSISHGMNLLLFNVAARYGTRKTVDRPDGRLIFTARAGLGPTIPHTESNIEGQVQEQYEIGRLAWQLGAGAEVNLWRGLYALGEYKFTRTRQHGKIFFGTAASLLRTHHGVFGISYRF